jgi:hypothetical protein
MKTTVILLSILFTLLVFGALDGIAQQLRELQPLEAHDFECMNVFKTARA